jgi:hypothetical protein
MNGPLVLTAKVYFTDGDKIAIVTCALPPGRAATAEVLAEALADVAKTIQAEMGAEFRPMTRHEFTREILIERNPMLAGIGDFAVPGPAEWD